MTTTTIKTLTALAAGAMALSTAAAVQAQTPYGSTQTQSYGQPQSRTQDAFGAILGALFGAPQTLDSEWSRGRRPLGSGSAQFDARLDAGIRDGSIDRYAATDLRADYQALVQLEARYAADGRMTTQERAELGRQYQELSQRVDQGDTGYDNGGGYDDRWEPLIDARADFDARLDAQQRARRLTRAEVLRLRADYQALIQIETGYQRGGIDAREQADLQLRLDDLNRRVGDNYDSGNGGGYGQGNRGMISRIEAAIATGERSGAIVRAEAERLRTELGDLTRLDAAYAENGLNADENAYLSRRFGELDLRVRNTRR